MESLKGAVLSTFSYQQTKQVCLEYPSIFGSPWDQAWVWKEKAMVEFDISEEFFALVPNLSPSQRYLQIKSYVTLTPDMIVKIHDGGKIEGVYELQAARDRAIDLDCKPMKRFFASGSFSREDEFTFSRKRNRELVENGRAGIDVKQGILEGTRSAKFLEDVLLAGRVDWLDQVIHRYFVLPPGFSIERDVPRVPFWAKEFPLVDLPIYTGSLDRYSIIINAICSSDTRIVDFFRSIFRDKIGEEISNFYIYNKIGLECSGAPEETFGVHKRFKQPEDDIDFPPMIEQVLDLAEDYEGAIIHNRGNVVAIQSILPFLTKEDKDGLDLWMSDDFPLSEKLLLANDM
jgi:hypothetical protein